ncbi:MAG: AAA family ATPase [Pseudomonadota bacterium]
MAQIKALRLSNFKSIGAETQEIEFAPITLLFGPNSAGKSTVLQALVFAREAILHGNLDPDTTDLGGDWLDLGGFGNVVHGRDLDVAIGLGVTLKVDSSDIPGFTNEHEAESLEEFGFDRLEDLFADLETVDIDMQIRWSEDRSRPFVEMFRCKLDGDLTAVIRSTTDGRQVYVDEMPLLSHIFQDPVDFLDDDRSLSELLSESLSLSLVERASRGLRGVTGGDRPFASFKIEELEELIEDDELPRQEVLQKLLEELGYRSTRRAATLERRVSSLVTNAPSQSSVDRVAINLRHQDGALPPLASGLVYEEDAWAQSSAEEELGLSHERATRLFLRRALDMAICGPLACFSSILEEMHYIGPLRDLPSRQIDVPKTKTSSRWAKGLAAWESLPGMEPQSIDEINYWLGDECLGSGYQVQLKKFRELPSDSPLYELLGADVNNPRGLISLLEELPEKTRVTLQDSGNGLSVMPQDIGVGISQLFPVVVASVSFKEALLAIEQAELHVHPRLQTELADMFIRYALDSENQFLLETHSEHLMLRLLRRVRDSMGSDVTEPESAVDDMYLHALNSVALDYDDNLEIASEGEMLVDAKQIDSEAANMSRRDCLFPWHLAVHYVEPSDTGTQFTRLRVSEDGDFLDEWPEGFFEERDDEVFF